jgi:hypothetical protein
MILDINHEACEGFQGNYFALAAVLREALLWSGGGDAAWSKMNMLSCFRATT